MKFVEVTNDIAFRKIFGNENTKSVLVSFLNAVLDLKDQHIIVEVNIKNPYQLPSYSGGKATIVDVKATDKNKNTFIVEMQVAEIKDFDKRVLYYASQSYTDQIERGDLYPNLKPIFFIAILNFQATQSTHYLSRHKILDTETSEHLIKDMEFTFVELTKFNKQASELKTVVEQWIYFLKNAENLDVIPDTITDKGLKDAFEQANKHNWSKEELEAYNKVFIREQDERGRLEFAENKGKIKGRKEGEIEGMKKGKIKGRKEGEIKGRKEERIEVAKRLKAKGMDIEFIIETTGLSKEEIEKL